MENDRFMPHIVTGEAEPFGATRALTALNQIGEPS
jgi:hypothetical protein